MTVGGTAFAGRTVLVAGGGSGIGARIAARFGEAGARTVIADIDRPAAQQVAGGITHAEAETLDITDADAVQEAVARIGHVDVLVNSAVVGSDTPFSRLSRAEWSRQVDVALTGPFLLCQAVLPGMVRAGSGAIVNISSVNALTYVGNEAYSAGKAGLLSLTRSIAVGYGRHGVRCNAVVPGTIRTPVWDRRLQIEPDLLERVRRWYPLGRVGSPDDVAAAVLFLAGEQAAWITGIALPVDGGLMAGNPMLAHEIVIAAGENER